MYIYTQITQLHESTDQLCYFGSHKITKFLPFLFMDAQLLGIKQFIGLNCHPFTRRFNFICMTVHVEVNGINDSTSQRDMFYQYDMFDKDKYRDFFCACYSTDHDTTDFVLEAIYSDRLQTRLCWLQECHNNLSARHTMMMAKNEVL